MAVANDNRASTARQVRERILLSQDRLWRVEEFDVKPSAVNSELRRLVARGELQRVRRGVYWRGRKSRFGTIGAPAGRALRELVGEKQAIGATGWYATNLLGLSTQVAPVETIAITARPPQGIVGVRVVSRVGRSARREAHLNETEVTMLEALDGWDRYIEADATTALRRFGELLERDDIRVEQLVKASRTEPPAVRERLRAVLNSAGLKAEAQQVRGARDPRTRERALSVLGPAA